ncbi:MAG: anti-sigma factor [Burkholderiales bacterium]
MRYGNNPELGDALAAQYALGTLRGRARRRLGRLARDDAALARAIREWEQRLAPLTLALPEIRPPDRVWRAIEQRVAMSARSNPSKPSLWGSLAFWRGWGLVTTGLAAGLIGAILLQPPQLPARAPVTVSVPALSHGPGPSYVALLGDPERKLRVMAYVARDSRELWFRIEGEWPLEGRGTYVMWALSDHPGAPPRAIAALPATREGTVQLAAVADDLLEGFPRMAVSLEPDTLPAAQGPKGPVLAAGECMKTW